MALEKSVLAETPGELRDGEARLPGIAKDTATAKSVLAEPLGELHVEAGLSWSRASGTSSVVGSTVAKPVDEARPPDITVYRGEQDTDACEIVRQADAVIKSINRSFSSASSCGDDGKKHTRVTTRARKSRILGGRKDGSTTRVSDSSLLRMEARTCTSIGNSWSVPRC